MKTRGGKLKDVIGNIGCIFAPFIISFAMISVLYLIIDGLLGGVIFTGWDRFFIIVIIIVCGTIVLVKSFPEFWKKLIMVFPSFLIIMQWFLFGQAHTSAVLRHYELRKHSIVRLPLLGSYAQYTGKSIIVKGSFFSSPVIIDVAQNDPKAISFNLIGDRLAVRFHESLYPPRPPRIYAERSNGFIISRLHWEGKSVIKLFDANTGEEVYSDFFPKEQKGYRHSRLHLVL